MSFSQTINIHTIIINNFAKFTFFFFFDQMKFWQKMCFGRSVCFFSLKINIFEQFHIKNDHYTLKCTKTRFFLNMYHFEFSRARHACVQSSTRENSNFIGGHFFTLGTFAIENVSFHMKNRTQDFLMDFKFLS